MTALQPPAPPSSFKAPVGHFWLDVWLLATILELAVRKFCIRHLSRDLDPCGRLFDQMAMAARSVPANIAEGHARRSTSAETQMRLYDVARASLVELSGDLRAFLLLSGDAPWSDADPDARAVFAIPLDPLACRDDLDRNVSLHILAQYAKFAPWLDAPSPLVSARSLLVLAARVQMMLSKRLARAYADFLANGGFAENLSRERIAARASAPPAKDAPPCPLCGKPMQQRIAKRGSRAGRPFWSCPDYPACSGTRPAD